jgi:hypothetical protein
MRKTFVFIVALFSLIACQKEQNQENFQLSGKIKGLKTGTLYVQQFQDSILKVVDSIVFDGQDTFKIDMRLESPEMLYLYLDRGVSKSMDNNLLIFAEPGQMNLETSLEQFYANAKITGSKNHDLWEQYTKSIMKLNAQNVTLIEKEFKAIRNKNQTLVDSITTARERILKRKYLQTINFALNHKDKDIAAYVALAEISDANLKYLDTIANSLSPEVKVSKYGKMLIEFLEERRSDESLN